MKKLIKSIADNAGYIVSKKQSYHNNYSWITNENIKSVMDIGANSGQYANQVAGILPDAKIYSFEPIPSVYKKLVANTGSLNIETFPFALGAKNEQSSINTNDFSPSSSLMEMSDLHKTNFDFAKTSTKETIEVRRADELLDLGSINKNILTKIDVQGFEDQVILGAPELLKLSKIIICEVSFKELYKGQKLFGEIFDMVRDLDFTYMGSYDQVYDYKTGAPIGGDAIFFNNKK